MKHRWVCISPGEYDSLYICTRCDQKHMESIDNPIETELPKDGCLGDCTCNTNSLAPSNHKHDCPVWMYDKILRLKKELRDETRQVVRLQNIILNDLK